MREKNVWSWKHFPTMNSTEAVLMLCSVRVLSRKEGGSIVRSSTFTLLACPAPSCEVWICWMMPFISPTASPCSPATGALQWLVWEGGSLPCSAEESPAGKAARDSTAPHHPTCCWGHQVLSLKKPHNQKLTRSKLGWLHLASLYKGRTEQKK